MQRLKVFLVTVIKTVLAKLKHLAIHIVKHPLGSIWWAIKMYFALMFFSLFVACSFGAFAQEYDPTDFKPAVQKAGQFCASTSPPAGGAARVYACADTKGHAVLVSAEMVKDELQELCAAIVGRRNCSVTISATNETSASFSLAFDRVVYTHPVTKEETTTPERMPNYRTSAFTFTISVASYVCPPTNENKTEEENLILSKYSVGPITTENGQVCFKPKPDEHSCFADPKYTITNHYHFAPQDAGKGSICVDTDSIGLCPFTELPDSKGVFVPETNNAFPCDDKPPSDPMPPPEPPENCTTTPSGMLVCKEDPNEKCTANSSNAMSCPPSCGYMNNVFVCFENPDVDPEQPEEPDVPRPPADDNIENPDKPISDMLKKDFKDVQRGVESRLDGFAADMANLIKTEKAAKDQENKNSAQGNKLLNSINQNTADTVKELKKLTEPGETVEGIEKPEFEEKNDWNQRNFGTVMKAKGDEIMNLPIMRSITNFFDVSFSGSCPTYAVSVWVFEINIDQFCSQQVQALFPYISAVVLLMCSFFAIRIALL